MREQSENQTNYAEFVYKRRGTPKRRGGVRIFPVIVLVVLLGVIALLANMFFGFVNFGGKSGQGAVLPSATVWVIETGRFNVKNNALGHARDVRTHGGAGFVVGLGGYLGAVADTKQWSVLENVYATREGAEIELLTLPETIKTNAVITEIAFDGRRVTLHNTRDTVVFDALVGSFYTNFLFLCDGLVKYKNGEVSAVEVCAETLQRYNELTATVREFDKIQENASSMFYARVLVHANRELLALYLLSGEGASANFPSALSNAICAVVFAYLDLVWEE